MQNPISRFDHGPLTIQLLQQETVINSVLDIPHLTICTHDAEDKDGETDKQHFIHLTAACGHQQDELIETFRSDDLRTDIISRVVLATGQTVANISPDPRASYYNHVYPEVALGELSAAGMKIFGKMNLTAVYTLRMYRLAHQNPLQYQPEICGIWKTATEGGVWALESKFRGSTCKLVVGDKEAFSSDLSHEFAKRWPFMPAEFMVTSQNGAAEWHKDMRSQKA